MDKTGAEGLGGKVAGSVKEAIGKVTGDTELEVEGKAQMAAQRGVKDAAHDAVKK